MSFDLYVWKAPIPVDEREAEALLERHLYSGPAFEKSDELKPFYDELSRVVDLDAFGDPTERLITLNLVWGTADGVLTGITELTAKYQLVVYDPQANQVHPPDPTGRPAQLPRNAANPRWWRDFLAKWSR